MSPAKLARIFPERLTWRFGIVVIALSVISFLIANSADRKTNSNTECLANYIAASSAVSQARAAATAERDMVSAQKDDANRALNEGLGRVVLHPNLVDQSQNLTVLRKLFLDYNQAAKRAQRAAAQLQTERAAHPLPTFPQRCKDLNN